MKNLLTMKSSYDTIAKLLDEATKSLWKSFNIGKCKMRFQNNSKTNKKLLTKADEFDILNKLLQATTKESRDSKPNLRFG